MVNFLAKQNISKLMESSPKQVKEGLMSQCATILACYRKNCASPSSAGQLILPECMKVKPLLVLIFVLSLSSLLAASASLHKLSHQVGRHRGWLRPGLR